MRIKLPVYVLFVIFFSSCHSGPNKNAHYNEIDMNKKRQDSMHFTVDPSQPAAGTAVNITLRPVDMSTDSTTRLEVQHEKKIHLIVVNEDLSYFRHLHPVEQADGSYTITHVFEKGGNYLLYADFKPVGSDKHVSVEQVKVSGVASGPVTYEKQSLQSHVDGYFVTLETNGSLVVSNKEEAFTAEIRDKNRILSPSELEDYLGEKAHMVIIGTTNKKYLHVHPMVMDNQLMLHTTFPEPGTYRCWLEFKKDGKVYVADFVIIVAPGKAGMPSVEDHQH